MNIETQVRSFLNHHLLYNDDDSVSYSDEESFLQRNLIDSTSVMEIVLFVEESYRLRIEDSEIIPENFDSVKKVANYVRSKMLEVQQSTDGF